MATPMRNHDEAESGEDSEITELDALRHNAAEIAGIVQTISNSPRDAVRLVQIVLAGMLVTFKKDEIDTETMLEKYNASFSELVRNMAKDAEEGKATRAASEAMDRRATVRPLFAFPDNGSVN